MPEFSYQEAMNIGCEFHGEQKTHAGAARVFYDARRLAKRSLSPPKSCGSEKSTRRAACFGTARGFEMAVPVFLSGPVTLE
jgi:hypothetical protein